jgi:hypothetical protein
MVVLIQQQQVKKRTAKINKKKKNKTKLRSKKKIFSHLDSRWTAVGTESINRWLRPVTYQNFSPKLLPQDYGFKN